MALLEIATNLTMHTVGFVRDAKWFTRPRISIYATASVVISAAVITWELTGDGITDPAGRPVGTDFISFWTVSSALLSGNTRAIYLPEALAALEQALLPPEHSMFFAWQYPPIALLLVYPLAILPYLWSLASWLAVGIVCYLTLLWRILPQPLTLWAGLGFPTVLLIVQHGQNALLTTALLGSALLLLNHRPIVAGILVGFLTFKPQLGLLLPVAFVIGRYWATLISAIVSSIALIALSVVLFGSAIWHDFFANIQLTRDILDDGLVPYYKMQSVFAAVRLVGGSLSLAYGLQALAAIGAAAAVAWVWKRAADPDLKNAALAVATPLATPFILDYDVLIVVPAIAWLTRKAGNEGMPPWQGTTLALLWVTPLVSRTVGAYANLPLAPFVMTAVLVSILARVSPPRHRCADTARVEMAGIVLRSGF
jgi:glycosyl transferase family 87